MTIQELDQHIRALANAFKISLVFELPSYGTVKPELSMAVAFDAVFENTQTKELKEVRMKGIVVAPVTNHGTYAIALHELGHLLHPLGVMETIDQDELDRLELLRERSAWEWAQSNALEWNLEMEHVKMHGLGSYEEKAKRLGIDMYVRASNKIAQKRALEARSDPEALRRFAKRILS